MITANTTFKKIINIVLTLVLTLSIVNCKLIDVEAFSRIQIKTLSRYSRFYDKEIHTFKLYNGNQAIKSNIEWSLDNINIADFHNDNNQTSSIEVYMIKPGSCTLSAEYNGKIYNYEIEVKSRIGSNVSLEDLQDKGWKIIKDDITYYDTGKNIILSSDAKEYEKYDVIILEKNNIFNREQMYIATKIKRSIIKDNIITKIYKAPKKISTSSNHYISEIFNKDYISIIENEQKSVKETIESYLMKNNHTTIYESNRHDWFNPEDTNILEVSNAKSHLLKLMGNDNIINNENKSQQELLNKAKNGSISTIVPQVELYEDVVSKSDLMIIDLNGKEIKDKLVLKSNEKLYLISTYNNTVWKSSKNKIFSVDNGEISANSKGKATLYVKSGNKMKEIKIVVK